MAPKHNPMRFKDPDDEDNEKTEAELLRGRRLVEMTIEGAKAQLNSCLKKDSPMPLSEYLAENYSKAATDAWEKYCDWNQKLYDIYADESWREVTKTALNVKDVVDQINNVCVSFLKEAREARESKERAQKRQEDRAEAVAARREDARLRAELKMEQKKKKKKTDDEESDDENIFVSDSDSDCESVSRRGAYRVDNFKLPPAKIPVFSGDFKMWQSFHDLFYSCVVTRRMSGAQKMQYLLQHVAGEAKAVIDAYPVTDESFKDAWELLKSRYDNNKALFRAYYKELAEFKGEVNESGVHARALADLGTKFISKATRLNGGKDFPWEWLLIAQFERHLNTEVLRLWDQHIQRWVKTKNADHAVDGIEKVKVSAMDIKFSEFRDFLVEHGELVLCGNRGVKKQYAEPRKPQSGTGTGAGTGNKKSGGYQVNHTTDDAARDPEKKSAPNYKCYGCGEQGHGIFHCEKFRNWKLPQRRQHVEKHNLCLCLRPKHSGKPCRGKCKVCEGDHHALLHDGGAREKDDTAGADETVAHNITSSCTTIFTTALVEVQDSEGKWQVCRAMLDDGASPNCITQRCVQRLGLEKMPSNSRIRSMTAPGGRQVEGCVRVRLRSRVHKEHVVNDSALVVDYEFSTMPARGVPLKNLQFIEGLDLADPKFFEPGPIDILICNRVYMASLDRLPHLGDGKTGPIARASRFGWLVTGAVPESSRAMNDQCFEHEVGHTVTVDSIDKVLERFWTVEEVEAPKYTVKEHELCVKHFASTFKLEDGRFTVRLPFNDKKNQLGESRNRALTRWNSLERKLMSNAAARDATNEFMRKYLELGHMTEVPAREVDMPAVYLPHHAVIKETSTTTKHRQVFDGSALTSSGVALNHALMVGPTEQGDLCSRLVQFRTYPIALTGDISMMYRQIWVAAEDRDYQRIFWRFSPDEELKSYRLNTVTYGTSSAPFLAIECLRTLARMEEKNHPEAAAVVLSDFYVDDLVTGADTVEKAIKLYDDVSSLVKKGGFELRKWASNSEEVLQHIPEELRDVSPTTAFEDSSTRTLGVKWLHAEDRLCFDLKDREGPVEWTKRSMSSAVASIFDPLGLLSPVTIRMKIFLQKLWILKIGWDAQVPENVAEAFEEIQQELPAVASCRIPRCVLPDHAPEECEYDLHGFCDASESAYSACFYVVTHHQSGRQSHLLIAKTKVAPLKKLTIPRLELCAALLLANLYRKIKPNLRFKVRQVYAWSDNTTVLHWLNEELHRLHTFVCNRVASIVEAVPATLWRHVRTEFNAADCASRGIAPSELAGHGLWWTGPIWLIECDPKDYEHLEIRNAQKEDDEEYRAEVRDVEVNLHEVLPSSLKVDLRVTTRISNYWKMLRARAVLTRWAKYKSLVKYPKVVCTVAEINAARNCLIRSVQEERFGKEIAALRAGKIVVRKDLMKLSPFLCKDGLLRVGGRLSHAVVSENQKHPIVLPGDHAFTRALVVAYHGMSLHGGPTLLRSMLGHEFWIIGARVLCKSVTHACDVCFKSRLVTTEQYMANLPPARVTKAPRVFAHTGVDYGGVFTVKSRAGRGAKHDKGYIALFVCFATKAIHLEFVSDLSTSAFIAAFHRFTATRGLPLVMESDNGTNFVGAANEFKKIYDDPEFQTELLRNRIQWKTTTPGSPHHGGLWEAGIKQAKKHLKRSFGDCPMTFEEWMTACKRVEACLNSRPLTPMSEDPEDLSVLTPGHFFVGSALLSVPEVDLVDVPENRLDAWRRVNQRAQLFWNRWRDEYLSTLQSRPKWWLKKDVEPGAAVILKDPTPVCKWKLGRIVDVFPGQDGVVRSVRVRTYAGDDAQGKPKFRDYDRTITKVCLLPFDGENPRAVRADASKDGVESPQRGQDVPA